MIRYEIAATTVTTAPPERVLSVLDDFSNWPRWMPSLERVRIELPPDDRPRQGYRFKLHGMLVHAEMEVIDYTPLSRATRFRISFPPFQGVNRCRLVPLGDGRYRIERLDQLELPDLVAHLIDATQRKRFEKLALEFLHALRRVVEQTPNGTVSPPSPTG
ncbi:SRPBCC family protein [Chloroflexus sp.]|uniref:SRPBCC family protein n=1 Tax=Chloroflexus sp. TaxID=1904827 RepID=UPI00298EEA63|nr:SRPBCC family protein [Chloroflexus sp.]MCS6889219.1 SRPBCC family protein [Chloroflexus sp.]MDW8404826.1 SRPBCC family protein [Chloroflexus sp.]